MQEPEPPAKGSSLNPKEILFILIKRRWLILICSLVGILAAAGFALRPPVYESQAKLLVRYVMERSAIDLADSQTKSAVTSGGETAINSEVEILTSWDLALQVAEGVGIERLLPDAGGEATRTDAARAVQQGLKVTIPKICNVILISFKHRDPVLARKVLDELVNRYYEKHLEVHRSVGVFDFVTRQTEQVKERLHQTEAELKQLRARAGINNLAESMVTVNAKLMKSQEQLSLTEVEQAEQRARVQAMEKCLGGFGPETQPSEGVQSGNRNDAQRYQTLMTRLGDARQRGLDLLSKYTPESRLVQLHEAQIENLERQRRDLEARFPGLAATAPAARVSTTPQTSQPDIVTERARLAAIDAKTVVLANQLQDVEKTAERLSEVETQIAQLERTKEQAEADYKYFEASLAKARIDEALDPTKIPNIGVVQSPSVALPDTKLQVKIVAGLASGGLALGLALAFLIELVLDRTVKRPLELEEALGAPLLLSIPYIADQKEIVSALHRPLTGGGAAALDIARSNKMAPIRPFFEAMRDRLILYFELNRMRHKPKLVAVTGLTRGAGVSTVAAGLAAALSETGDGKVLLVDMNNQHAQVHPFFHGKPAPHLSEALLTSRNTASSKDTLYLATVTHPNDSPAPHTPKRFFDLMPDIKASDFDFVIFDMPPIDQTSVTLAMSSFMDKVLFVVEAEMNDREAVKRTFTQLVDAKADVSAVLNKKRTWVPQWLDSHA